MSFPRYPDYKHSGNEWLGQVPTHWEVRRLKNLVEEPLKYGANESAELDDRTLPRFIRITDINDGGGLREETFKSLPVAIAEPYLLQEGDVLLARSGATVGKSFIYSAQWGTACFAGYLIRARLVESACLARWLYYFCQTGGYWSYVVGSQIQATIQNVSAEKYANLFLPLPPIYEQTKIAMFLDRETAKIDALVTEQQRLIELLKEKRQAVISHAVTKGLNPDAPMKPSGLEWLGEVPAHWEITKLKRIATIRYGIGEPPQYHVEGTPLIRATNVHAGKLFAENLVFVDPGDIPEKRIVWLSPGDIIVVRSGAYTGDSAIIPEGFGLCIAGFDMVLRCHSARPAFMQYALLSKYLKDGQIDLASMRAAQPHLNAEELGSSVIALPNLQEEDRITEFLNSECERFDILISEAQRAIDLLQERRSAIISAAVTGQIDVRGLARQQAA